MNSAEIERLIARISWGHIPVTVIKQNGDIVSLLLHPPTPKEQAKAANIYSVEYNKATIIGLATEDNMLESLINIGQWSVEKNAEITGLQKDIQTIRKGLLDFVFNVTKLEKARSLLRRAENALMERLHKKHCLLQDSAESHAEICKQRYMIGQITEEENGKPLWLTTKDFDNCNDNELITQLCESFFYRSRIPIKSIRELARSQQWRSYWEVSKNTNDLFDNPITSWSLNQRELAYWSTIYDSVYNAYERPSKEIVDDDDLLDSWFIRQGEKVEGKTQSNTTKTPSKPGRNEEFIMADREGAKQVYKMNDPSSRIKIKARQKLLQKQGSIKEQDMPDSQREMREQLANMRSKHTKDISRR